MIKYRCLLAILMVLTASCSKDEQTTTVTTACGSGQNKVTDIDGNVYNIIRIGGQCWMKENLRVSRYRNGDSIPVILDDSTLLETTVGNCTVYELIPANEHVYGKLYSGYAVMDPRELCPTGWHVPTESEWNVLIKTLDQQADTSADSQDQSQVAGGYMKTTGTFEASTGLWYEPNTGATNSSGFTGRPGGYRMFGNNFYCLGMYGDWWTSTLDTLDFAWHRSIAYDTPRVYRVSSSMKMATSVRCIRD